jgi:hypothetical protein
MSSQFELVPSFAFQISQLLSHFFEVVVKHLFHGFFLPRSFYFFPEFFDDLQAGLVQVVDQSGVFDSFFLFLFRHYLALGFQFLLELVYLRVQQGYLLAPLSVDTLEFLLLTGGKLSLLGFERDYLRLVLALLLFQVLILPQYIVVLFLDH